MSQGDAPPVDHRNDLAKARDVWLESDEGQKCADGVTSGYYLHNRLEAAFIAGWKAREAQGNG